MAGDARNRQAALWALSDMYRHRDELPKGPENKERRLSYLRELTEANREIMDDAEMFGARKPYPNGHYYYSGGKVVKCQKDDPVLKVLQGRIMPWQQDSSGRALKQPPAWLRDKLRTDGKTTPPDGEPEAGEPGPKRKRTRSRGR